VELRFKQFLINLFFNRKLIISQVKCDILRVLDNYPNLSASRDARPTSCALPNILSSLAHHPQKLFQLWNWKSATLSIILRGPIFLVAAIRQGWAGALGAVLIESAFCAVSAGFYGAVVQSLKDAQPQWLTGVLLAVVIPMFFQGIEYILHWFRGTPHLRIAAIVSLIISGLSALFNWFAMRRGTLLVGGEGDSFGRDLSRIPRLLLDFIVVCRANLQSARRIARSSC
jgi:hypothetical protein